MALSSSVFLQQVLTRVQLLARAQIPAQKFGMRRLEVLSLEVPSAVHLGVRMANHSMNHAPVGLEGVLDWVEVHEVVAPWGIPLLPRPHLPMYLEEPWCRKVSAYLSK